MDVFFQYLEWCAIQFLRNFQLDMGNIYLGHLYHRRYHLWLFLCRLFACGRNWISCRTICANIFNKVLPKGGWKHACICTLTYLIGSTATVLIVAHFLILLLIVLIALFLLSLLGKSSSSSGGKRCSNCSHLSGSSCNLSGRYISSPSTTYCDNYQ